MKTSHRRIALLTGASLSALGVTALGIASPATAAPHDALAAPTTNSGTSTTASPIDLCTIGAATADCFMGVYVTNDGATTALVNSTATGWVRQNLTDGTVELTIDNPAANSAEIGAIATASGAATQTANATISSVAIRQTGSATTGDGVLNINNGGTLLIDALANATASTGNANANASVQGGIWQTLTVAADADGTVNLTNAGTLTIEAVANAHAPSGTANAIATLDTAIFQGAFVNGDGNAVTNLTNTGTIHEAASANATGSSALASANLTTGIWQSASVTGAGDATNNLTNSPTGVINITAAAHATGSSVAHAYATVNTAVNLSATAADGNATNNFTNDGSMNIQALAVASASSGSASATASIDTAFSFSANASGADGAAVNNFTNNGTLTIGATASANGSTFAFATANLTGEVWDYSANATDGNASNLWTNSSTGTVKVTALANATAASGNATANASMTDGVIDMSAIATGADHTALNSIDNSGTLDIEAIANANAHNGNAHAFASIETGFTQSATGNTGANATNVVNNAGTINIGATATARVTGIAATGTASAQASLSSAIYQSAQAFGGGEARNTISNATTGVINITAAANALSTTSSANATVDMETVIRQSASATGGGDAISEITNAGTINITGAAQATGSNAFASVSVDEPVISQTADATSDANATVTLTNSGNLNITAHAVANSTRNDASAFASLSSGGIFQSASATGSGLASVTLNNTGNLNIHASATANAETSAYASAFIQSGISQVATGDSGGASVTLTNGSTGVIDIAAIANANGNSGSAYASVISGVYQAVTATSSGNATALIDNQGSLSVRAIADAEAGVNDAFAFASIEGGVYQFASASSGTASATLNNGGTLNVIASAIANGVTFASAYASVATGISQTANGTGVAAVTLDNSGTLNNAEVGINGVKVRLLKSPALTQATDISGNMVADQTTSGGGYYRFDNLLAGDYVVEVSAMNFASGMPLYQYLSSTADETNPNADVDGNDNGVGSTPNATTGVRSGVITLGPGLNMEATNDNDPATNPQTGEAANGQSNRTVDFGFFRMCLGNLVWNDANNNGVVDAGEAGIGGAMVELIDAGGNVVQTTTTASDGTYQFCGLLPGSYRVRVMLPANYTSSTGAITATGPYEPAPDPNNDVDDDDNGSNMAGTTSKLISLPITLTPGGEPSVDNATATTRNDRLDLSAFLPSDLTITKTHAMDPFMVGMNADYIITVRNLGPGVASGTITVTDVLPNGLTSVSAAGVGWTCGAVGQAVTCTSAGPLAVNATSTITLTVGVFNAASPAVTNTANVQVATDTNLANNTAGDLTTVSNGLSVPGTPLPETSQLSDQKPGSLLIYPVYSSDATNPNRENTRISLTNADGAKAVCAHLFFVDGNSCSVADSILCLTPNQTASFLMSDLDPGTTGYVVAVAINDHGCPIAYNKLLGDEYVKFSSGHQANLGAESYAALYSGVLPGCDDRVMTAALNLDGVQYNLTGKVLAGSNVGSFADGNSPLLVLTRTGGNLATGASSLGSLFGLFYDDTESALSFQIAAGTCQLKRTISNDFPRTAPRLNQFIPAGRSGWFKVWMTGGGGMVGAILNANPNAGSGAGAFTGGHTLHKLTLTSDSFTIPVFPTPQ